MVPLKRLVRVSLVAATLFVLGLPSAHARTITILNQNASTLYVALSYYVPAASAKSHYNSWVTEGWFTIAPGTVRQLYSGESDTAYVRMSIGSGSGPYIVWNADYNSDWVNNSAFRIEEGENSTFPAYVTAPGSARWAYSSSDLTKKGWKSLSRFYKLSSSGWYWVSGPKKIYSKTESFDWSASWNSTTTMDRKFYPPRGSKIVFHTVSLSSTRGVKSESWSRNSSYVSILGFIAGSGNFWDQWRGKYQGSVTYYYTNP